MHHSSALVSKLKEEMKAKGVTTVTLADQTGIPYGTLSTWLSGRSILDVAKLQHRRHVETICKSLNLDFNKFIESIKDNQTPLVIAPGKNVLEILLTTIENPHAPKQQREDAKNIIREWLKDLS